MRTLLFLFITLICIRSEAQSPYTLPGTEADVIADRWDILSDFDHEVFSSQRNLSRKEITLRAISLLQDSSLSKKDAWDVNYILNDNTEYIDYAIEQTSGVQFLNARQNEKVYDSTGVFYHIDSKDGPVNYQDRFNTKRKPILKHFYKTKANFFEINEPNFKLRVNPIINFRYGNALDDEQVIFQNTRGIELRGTIDKKVYFYSNILENQAQFNNFIRRRIEKYKSIPGQGLYKPYDSGVIESVKGQDFSNAQAYIGYNLTKSIAIELGHGKHFIGNGIRSLLLSDYAHNYFYLKFNTRIWKLQYQNLFAELAPISGGFNPGDNLLPKKYIANHYLSYKPTKNIEVGLFETVIFNRQNSFEFQYLNPVILYRTAEYSLDSPDNVIIGLNAKWNILHRFQIYGQLILDEFSLDNLSSGNGWWANKFGTQIGLKYINVLNIDHLDAQVEYNVVRPYTYSHRDSLELRPIQSSANYSHYNQPLAHPLGANFKEFIFTLRYRPTKNLYINTRLFKTQFGDDLAGENNGGDILLVNGSRKDDFGNEIGQGIMTDIFGLRLDINYQFYHNYNLDLNFLYRKSDAALDEFDVITKYIGGGLRVNISNMSWDY